MKPEAIALVVSLLSFVPALHAQNTKFNLLIGTYTNTGKSEGIYVYEFNSQTGQLSYKNKTPIKNPSFFAVSANNRHVYALSSDNKGSIYSYDFDPVAGDFHFLNKQSSGGEGPCYVSTDSKGKYVFTANYNGGCLAAIPVLSDGSLGDHIQVIKHEGHSIDKERQTKPYVHSVVLSPDEKYLFAQDLGTDKLYAYQTGRNKTALTEAGTTNTTPGSGPRHLTFHPNKKFAYLIQEMGGLITVYNYQNGTLSPIQEVSTGAPGFTGELRSADIHVSPDGKFLYGSNRGDANEVVIYAVNQKTGLLSFAGRHSSIGKTPRNFVIDPTGNFLLVANQDTDDIYVFKRNKQTGLLTATGGRLEVGSPVCLKFVPAQ